MRNAPLILLFTTAVHKRSKTWPARWHLSRALALLTLFPLPSFSQSTPPTAPFAFDVVSIKPSRSPGWNMYPTPDGYTGKGISLRQLVKETYRVWDDKLLTGGPDWIDKDKFDLEAKFDAAAVPGAKNLTDHQRADMLRAVLADRFQLRVHFEKKVYPTYNLVIAKRGPKLVETPPEKLNSGVSVTVCLHTGGRSGLMAVEGCTTKALAEDLLYPAGRTVVDKTGLKARYSFELHWAPDNTPADSPLAALPSIFTALQEQLGLKLDPSTAPLDVLVIDHAERPSEN
jgi:uncharacterized protein (TIGR03435 family)